MKTGLDLVLQEVVLNYYCFDKKASKFYIYKRGVSIYQIQEMNILLELLNRFGIEFEVNFDDSISILQ